MNFNLYITYWSLFCITIISSSFLFFVVATENAKYVAAASKAAAVEGTAADFEVPAAADVSSTDAAASNDAPTPHTEILPNYKKVKKLQRTDKHPADVVPTLLPLVVADDDASTSFVAENPSIAAASDANDLNENSIFDGDVASESVVVAVDAAAESTTEAAEAIEDLWLASQVEAPTTTVSAEQLSGEHSNTNDEGLPDITEIPTVTTVHTITEIPLEVLEPTLNGVDSLIMDGSAESASEGRINRTLELLVGNSEEIQKDEEIIKINDSGGDSTATDPPVKIATEIPSEVNENIPQETVGDAVITPTESTTNATQPEQSQQQQSQQQPAEPQPTPAATEEVPIPVFSEWAQKQMEAAEKQQQLEQDVVNTSTQKKNNNNTNGGNKLPQLKLRAKNYASPDCGAKIIASNADASNTGAVLSSSKDEYMLSPCTQRVWFVVELCEAIQAQKIDLANFELFSSSPRNFTVAVSNRFPTRDWSNVGRFIAEDKRTVQSFDLHPHLFGKFVRIDIHSHYSKEHFCPVSLFRVFGTSEFEAFETENHPNDDLDDFDDEFNLEQAHVKNPENNLFKSASDAVLSIVKKAAEVLAKPASNTNATQKNSLPENDCQTLAFGQFSCAECNNMLVERINTVLSCKYRQLSDLLRIPRLYNDLLNTQICAKNYGIETQATPSESCALLPMQTSTKQSYFLNLLPTEYVGALCQLVAENISIVRPPRLGAETKSDDAEVALNLTIDKKLGEADFKTIENIKENNSRRIIKTAEEEKESATEKETTTGASTHKTITTTEPTITEDEQLSRPPQFDSAETAATSTSTVSSTGSAEQVSHDDIEVATKDVNIFNLNTEEAELTPDETQGGLDVQTSLYEGSADHSGNGASSSITSSEMPPSPAFIQKNSDEKIASTEDPSSWDSIDNLLTSTTAAPIIAENSANQAANVASTAGASAGIIVNGINMQQKIPTGPYSESIFIRLSNRIKALERNMSLSGQYLEELSRRYKKQVEELQQTLTQQTLNVRSLEEQNRRHSEFQQLLSQRNVQLKDELDDLTLQVHACIVVIIFVGAFVFLVLMVGILFIRSMRRETKELQAYSQDKKKSITKTSSTTANGTAVQRKLNRRKSYEDFSDHQQILNNSNVEKQRRPSEEAMLILKECAGDISDTCAKQTCTEYVGDTSQDSNMQRHRKVSVCYIDNNNCNMNGSITTDKVTNVRRRNDKHSWPNSEQSQKLARQHLEELSTAEHYDKFTEKDLLVRQQNVRSKTNQLTNGGNKTTNESMQIAPKNKSSKKKTQNAIKRQVSAPNNMSEYSSLPKLANPTHARIHSLDDNVAHILKNNHSDYDESLLLDEDDLDNFLPGTDLVYNEFMPEGPSGYHIATPSNAVNVKTDKKKSRRLSSPAFFKSPFSKSLKSKSPSTSTSPPPVHESTSWEWYRLKKSDSHKRAEANSPTTKALAAGNHNFLRPSASSGFPQRSSPAVSIDSTSLSEINFPTNSNENSFRILEEAILGNATTTTNGNGNSSSSGGSSSIRSSSTTSSKKKKSRSFNKIFRKVF